MLVAAAARTWEVDPGSCRTQRGVVTHATTGRTLTYGALAEQAAKLPAPEQVALKDPKDLTLICTPAKRLDTPDKVNGKAQYSIDVRLPGLKIATLAESPVLGGKVASLDASLAQAIPGVRQIVRLDDLVAVVADHMWAAKQGLAALVIRWDEGPNAKVSTADVVRELDAASQQAGVVARKQGDGAPGHGLPAGEGGRPQPSAWGWIRPPARGRLRNQGRSHRERGRRPGESRLDAGGGHPARCVSPLLLRPDRRGPEPGRQAGRLDPSVPGSVHPRPLGASRVQGRARRRRDRRGCAAGLRYPSDPGRVPAPRGTGAPHRLLARGWGPP